MNINSNISLLQVESFDILRRIIPEDNITCYVTDIDTFYWDSTSTLADDNQDVIKPTDATTGRWLRSREVEFASNAETAAGTNDRKVITPESLDAQVLGSPRYLVAWRDGGEQQYNAVGRIWTPLSFTNLSVNRISGSSIGNGFRNFTLPAGTYQLQCLNSGNGLGKNTLRIYSVTDLAPLTNAVGNLLNKSYSTVSLRTTFTLASENTIQVQYLTELAGFLGVVPPEGITTYPVTQLVIGRLR